MDAIKYLIYKKMDRKISQNKEIEESKKYVFYILS
jgi:hypothetical protein